MQNEISNETTMLPIIGNDFSFLEYKLSRRDGPINTNEIDGLFRFKANPIPVIIPIEFIHL